MKKIIVGIPSYNESRRIQYVIEQIDKGLVANYSPQECLIVNLDSNSPDQTKKTFLSTKTQCQKQYFSVKRGKGHALIAFWEFVLSEKAEAAGTFDADIKTISPDWVGKLFKPVTNGTHDVVSPVYKRNRFAGGITNHFAYPLIYSVYNRSIRQPLAGEYAYSNNFVKFLLQQVRCATTLRYGIDFFITANALYGGFIMLNRELGRKIDKPGFSHQKRMLLEVTQSAFFTTKNHMLDGLHSHPDTLVDYEGDPLGIDIEENFPHRKSLGRLMNELRKDFNQNDAYNKKYLGNVYSEIKNIVYDDNGNFTAELWTDILVTLLTHCYSVNFSDRDIPILSKVLLPLYRRRIISFWLSIEGKNPGEVENAIVQQAKLLQQKFNKNIHI